MRVRDMRKEPKESLPTFDMLAANDVFELPLSGNGPFMKTTNSTWTAVWLGSGEYCYIGSGDKVRRLKATLVLEDEGRASK